MKVLSIIFGILIMIAGVVFLFHPGRAAVAIGLIFSIGLILGGINAVVLYFARKIGSGWNVFFGIVSAACGIFLLSYGVAGSFAVTFVMSVVMAAVIIMSGIAGIAGAVELKRLRLSWGYVMFFGIFSVVVGLVAICVPLFAADLLLVMFSISLIMEGIDLISISSFLGRVEKVAKLF